MEHLSKKPFYLTDEDILWVGNTLAGLSEDEKIDLLLFPPEHDWPFFPVGRKNALRIKTVQNEGHAACVCNFPGDEADERDYHLVFHMNTLPCEKWEKTFGVAFRSCIDEGALAVMVSPILFPAYLEKLNPGLAEENMSVATLAYEISTVLLREQLGFNGVAVAESITDFSEIPRSVDAGCDLVMIIGKTDEAAASLKKGVADGIVTPQRLREAAVRILGLKAALGLHK
jgi:beta-N-acetylhexosaminidase